MDFLTLILGVVVFVLVYWYFSVPTGLPPSPPCWPILGHTYLIKKAGGHMHLLAEHLGEEYSKIVTLQFGSTKFVAINDLDTLKEAFSQDALSGRFTNYVLERAMLGRKLGITFNEGPDWSELRRFTLRHLKDFGFGKRSHEEVILDEAHYLVERLKNHGVPRTFQNNPFTLSTMNVLWCLVSGKRYRHNDDRLVGLLQLQNKMVGDSRLFRLYVMPWLRFILPPSLSGVSQLNELSNKMFSLFQEVITEHKETYDPNHMRDLTDTLLREIMARCSDKSSVFHEDQLLVILNDMFSAGAETTSTALYWMVLLLMMHPEVQEKVQEEVDNAVGGSRLPSLDDRKSMPYTEAMIMEVLRFRTPLPVPPGHKALRDTTISGYNIPKDTVVTVNLYWLMNDPKYWKNPEVFNPERFLDENGQLKKEERFVAFGNGKRSCIGENLAKMELFLFITLLLQQLKFAVPEGEKPTLEPQAGFTHAPKPYNCDIIIR